MARVPVPLTMPPKVTFPPPATELAPLKATGALMVCKLMLLLVMPPVRVNALLLMVKALAPELKVMPAKVKALSLFVSVVRVEVPKNRLLAVTGVVAAVPGTAPLVQLLPPKFPLAGAVDQAKFAAGATVARPSDNTASTGTAQVEAEVRWLF